MLSNQTRYLLKNTMCIDCAHLESKAAQLNIPSEAYELISDIVEKASNRIFNESDQAYEDNLRKIDLDDCQLRFIEICAEALHKFSNGGMLDLFKYQSNENWYPKIIIDKPLLTASIEHLPEIIEIYRGGSISEMDTGFRQSWTQDLNSAKKFAIETYSESNIDNNCSMLYPDDDKHLTSTRCVFKAQINKKDIFAYFNDHEEEVVIDVTKLINIERL